MPDAFDAFAARVVMATRAQRSIDVQYFIWHDDQVGMLLLQALWQAAERGVRVRLLLDDGGTSGIDGLLAMVDAHPNIELRLYNPFAYRGSRALGYMTDFQRLNKRMHNKSFTADNQVSVVGGRNIANEYFGAAGAIGFADLDVLAIGAVVPLVSAQFDRYWNSASAYPAAQFLAPPPADAAQLLQAAFAKARADPASVEYLKAVIESRLLTNLLNRSLDLDWTHARLLYDDPAKTLDRSARTDILLFPALMESLGKPVKSFDIVSPYFVPGDNGTALLAELARSGVRVRVLTNSLASSDESVVHAGYLKRRRDLLRAGVKLYELKPTAKEQSVQVRGRFGAGKVAGPACQDLRRRRPAHLHRLVQLRPALGTAEHRTGRGARQPAGGRRTGRAVRPRTCARWPTKCASRRRVRVWCGSSTMPRAPRSATTWTRRPTGACASRSASCPACRSTGCCSHARRSATARATAWFSLLSMTSRTSVAASHECPEMPTCCPG